MRVVSSLQISRCVFRTRLNSLVPDFRSVEPAGSGRRRRPAAGPSEETRGVTRVAVDLDGRASLEVSVATGDSARLAAAEGEEQEQGREGGVVVTAPLDHTLATQATVAPRSKQNGQISSSNLPNLVRPSKNAGTGFAHIVECAHSGAIHAH